MLRFVIALLAGALVIPAQEAPAQGPPVQDWSLAHLFTRPFVWGAQPTGLRWARKAHVLVFRWNASGGTFHDVYAYHADSKRLVRLTALEALKDTINETPAEKDKHEKNYLAPAAGVGGFDVSDDGTKVAFSYRGDLYIANTSTSEAPVRLTRTRVAESNPQFSPDGKKLAYELLGQIYVQDLGNGFREQITNIAAPGSLGAYHWSPDGRSFVYEVAPPSRMVPIPNYSGQFVVAPPFQRDVAGDAVTGSQFYVIASDASELEARKLDLGKGIEDDLPVWSKDSRLLLAQTYDANHKGEQVLVADAELGKSTVIFRDTDPAWVYDSPCGWAPDSKHVWLISERDGHGHLYTVGIDGKDLKQITHGAWDVMVEKYENTARPPQWIGGFIYYSSTQEGAAQRQLFRVKADGSEPPEKLSKRAGINAAVISEDGKMRATFEADMANPLDVFVNGDRVTRSPLPAFYKYAWARSRFVTYLSPKDHQPVAARLLLPPGYDPDDTNQPKRPAVVYIHGSGYATSVLNQWGSYVDLRFVFNEYLAHEGYVVIEMDYRGSSGYGRDWRTGVYLNLGGPDLDDVVGAVDYLKTLKNVDTNRVGIWGVSYGGFMTANAMFKAPDVFAAGAAWSGVYDWENYNSWYTGQRLTTPAENPEAYRRSSPIWFSGDLKNHLLLVHGVIDNNVLFQDAVQLSEKLIHEGKPFEQAFYPEERHGFIRDETLIDAFERTAKMFDKTLKQP